MIKEGCSLTYTGEESINYDGKIELGEEFVLCMVENTFANVFYWIENDKKNLVLINDEINAFEAKCEY